MSVSTRKRCNSDQYPEEMGGILRQWWIVLAAAGWRGTKTGLWHFERKVAGRVIYQPQKTTNKQFENDLSHIWLTKYIINKHSFVS